MSAGRRPSHIGKCWRGRVPVRFRYNSDFYKKGAVLLQSRRRAGSARRAWSRPGRAWRMTTRHSDLCVTGKRGREGWRSIAWQTPRAAAAATAEMPALALPPALGALPPVASSRPSTGQTPRRRGARPSRRRRARPSPPATAPALAPAAGRRRRRRRVARRVAAPRRGGRRRGHADRADVRGVHGHGRAPGPRSLARLRRAGAPRPVVPARARRARCQDQESEGGAAHAYVCARARPATALPSRGTSSSTRRGSRASSPGSGTGERSVLKNGPC